MTKFAPFVTTGVTVTFSLSGQSGTASASTGINGVATASLVLAGPPRSATLTASASASSTYVASSASSAFSVTQDATNVSINSSQNPSHQGDPVTFTATVTAVGPSIAPPSGTVSFFVDGSPLGSPVTLGANGQAQSIADTTLTQGNHTVTADYSGDTNYPANSASLEQQVSTPLVLTTTGFTAAPASSVYGQPVTLTATVAPVNSYSGTGVPSGKVEFFDGSTDIGSTTLNGTAGNDQATLTVSSLPVGSDSLTASYQGDNTFAASSSQPATETVNPDPTSIQLALSQPSSTPVTGQALTYHVTVSPDAPGSGTPTGTVEISVDGQGAGSGALSGGSVDVSISGLNAGSHAVSVSYSGDTDFSPSSGQLTQKVDPAQTTTSVVASPNPSITGQAVTITATVAPVSPGAGNPTGLVAFYSNGTAIGSAALSVMANGDQATIGLSSLAQGDDSLTASFPGDGNFAASTSQPFDETVNPAPPAVRTTTKLLSSANPSVYGQGVSWTATVSAADGSTPVGDVVFSLDGNQLGNPVPLDSSGKAVSPTVSNMVPGTHTIVAAYEGAVTPSAQYIVSGFVGSQVVEEAATTAQLSVTPNPAPYGQALNFSVTVEAVAPGEGTPGGSAQFAVDGADVGSPVTLKNGTATLTDSSKLAPGSHTLSVVTSGSSDFEGTNASVVFSVNTALTTTELSASPTSTTYGQTVILTATVNGSGGPPTPPSGKVVFLDGATTIGSTNLSTSAGGLQQAALSVSTLAVGTHTISADYQGDGNYAPSTSNSVTVTVNKAPTSMTATPALLETQITVGLNGISTEVVALQPLSATLTSGGNGLGGQAVSFAASSTPLCTSTTGPNGTATCSPNLTGLLAIILNGGYSVSYSGNGSYLASSATAPVIDTQVHL